MQNRKVVIFSRKYLEENDNFSKVFLKNYHFLSLGFF
jgi:hypothetical protein